MVHFGLVTLLAFGGAGLAHVSTEGRFSRFAQRATVLPVMDLLVQPAAAEQPADGIVGVQLAQNSLRVFIDSLAWGPPGSVPQASQVSFNVWLGGRQIATSVTPLSTPWGYTVPVIEASHPSPNDRITVRWRTIAGNSGVFYDIHRVAAAAAATKPAPTLSTTGLPLAPVMGITALAVLIAAAFRRPHERGNVDVHHVWKVARPPRGSVLRTNSLFEHPHPSLMPIQEMVAQRLLATVGVAYVPNALRNRLQRQDAIQATRGFLHDLGLTLDLTVESRTARLQLATSVGVLKEGDLQIGRTDLDRNPILLELRNGCLDHARRLSTKLAALAQVARLVEDESLHLAEVRGKFVEPTVALLSHWDHLSEAEAETLRRVAEEWLRLQRHTERLVAAALAVARDVLHKEAGDSAIVRTVYEMEARVRALAQNAEDGTTDLATICDGLQGLLDDLTTLKWFVRPEAPEPNPDLSEAMKVLGLRLPDDLDASLVRSTFRDMARRAHPDLGGNIATFTRLTDAYSKVRRALAA